MKFRVFFQTVASGIVDVDVPDSITDVEEAREFAENHANPDTMYLCYQCSGDESGYSLELGEWEPAYDEKQLTIPAELIKDND